MHNNSCMGLLMSLGRGAVIKRVQNAVWNGVNNPTAFVHTTRRGAAASGSCSSLTNYISAPR